MSELKTMKNIAAMNKEEVKTFINSFDTVISDCDGVLWVFGSPITGSPQTANKLITLGKKFMLLSNNTIIPLDYYIKICKALGMPIPQEDIFTPATALVKYLKSCDLKDKKVFVVGPETLSTYLKQNNIECCDTGVNFIPEDIGSIRKQLQDVRTDVGAVVLDSDVNLSYLKFMRATIYLRNPDCIFLAGATDVKFPVSEGEYVPGPGLYLSILEQHSGRKAVVVGKPSTYMVDEIVKDRHLDRSRVLFIGDSLAQDIMLGKTAGFQTLLVLSGNSKLADVNQTNQPDYYIQTLSDLLPLLPQS